MKTNKIKWVAPWHTEINANAEDGDYLREQQCCTSCGAYIGDLPGAFYLEDSDECPKCRTGEKWSSEVIRIIKRDKMNKEDSKQLIFDLKKYDI